MKLKFTKNDFGYLVEEDGINNNQVTYELIGTINYVPEDKILDLVLFEEYSGIISHYEIKQIDEFMENLKKDNKKEEAIKDMKQNFAKSFGLSWNEFKKRLSSPRMQVLIKHLIEYEDGKLKEKNILKPGMRIPLIAIPIFRNQSLIEDAINQINKKQKVHTIKEIKIKLPNLIGFEKKRLDNSIKFINRHINDALNKDNLK